MIKDLTTHSITVFRLAKPERFDPRQRVIEFDMIDDHQPMYASLDEAVPIQIHRQRVDIKTIGLEGIHYKYALDPKLQELVDELLELETRELHREISNLYRRLMVETNKTCQDRFVDWLEIKVQRLKDWYARENI